MPLATVTKPLLSATGFNVVGTGMCTVLEEKKEGVGQCLDTH